MAPIDVLRVLNAEDANAVRAVEAALPVLARLVEVAVGRLREGGAVHYFGAGTSGRLAVLDAAELRPTFSLPKGVVTAHIAGGPDALTEAVEAAEDSWELGRADALEIGERDVVIGLAASGGTPYVGGALERAREVGAATALIACTPGPRLGPLADILVIADTGPEVLAGSTRLKAGTAEKLALNGFSTALMVALGRTWRGLMVSVVASNDKLRARTVRMLATVLDVDAARAVELLEESDGELKTAIVANLLGIEPDAARAALELGEGSIANVLAAD